MYRGKKCFKQRKKLQCVYSSVKSLIWRSWLPAPGEAQMISQDDVDLLTFEQERDSVEKENNFSIICCVCLLPWKNRINPKLLEPWQSFGWRNWARERGSELPKPHDGLATGTRERWRPLSGNDRNWHRLVAFWFLAIGVSSLMQSFSFAKSPTKGKQVSFFYTDFHTKQKDVLAEKTTTAWVVSLDREGFKWQRKRGECFVVAWNQRGS